jgi:hypothetical protein
VSADHDIEASYRALVRVFSEHVSLQYKPTFYIRSLSLPRSFILDAIGERMRAHGFSRCAQCSNEHADVYHGEGERCGQKSTRRVEVPLDQWGAA